MKLMTSLGSKRLRSERGQSLVLAIIVMFLLVLVGSIFVLIVAHNQGNAGRAKDVLKAQYLAEAGVQYADKMLRTSELGADWRPVPDNLPATMSDHPDYKWLQAYSPAPSPSSGPTGGYTSFTMGGGRFLLRVSYNPNPKDPISKYIKIESIGRIGVIDVNDPTTYSNNYNLRRELIAYKPIGVTDYARFITNKDKRSEDLPLGAEGFSVKFGDAAQGRGAPIRVNGNLAWYGDNIDVVLRGITTSLADGTAGPDKPVDQIEVAGDVSNMIASGINIHEVIADPTGAATTKIFSGLPGSEGNFVTAQDFYRDGSSNGGYYSNPTTESPTAPRGVKRIEPPIINSSDTATKVARYLSLTRDSGVWLDGPNGQVNSGRFGWGKGIYVDNKEDLQPESETIFGGVTMRSDWMKPNNQASAFWKGPSYVPPGIIITLNPYDTDGDNLADITITRTINPANPPSSGRVPIWYDAIGNPIPNNSSSITVPYPQGTQTLTYGNNQTLSVERNGVIYADGNIRIHGMLAPGKQLTVVSGGTIYIEGNVLKYHDQNGARDDSSAIALLAKQYVCVNTTQFVSLLTSTGSSSFDSDSVTGDPPYHLVVTSDPSSTFTSVFSFGPRTGNTTVPYRLFTRHAGQYGPSYVNMWLNRHLIDMSTFYMPTPPFQYIYGVGDRNFWNGWNDGAGLIPGLYEHKVWNMNDPAIPAAWLFTNPGMQNVFEIGLDASSATRSNYLLSAFTIQPMDIRIEAIIYAQERSFYMIPGNWFNLDATDNMDNYNVRGTRPKGVDKMWPLFGQPLDVKITVDGAITENRPAQVADVSEWYSKWSNIPANYGTSTEGTAHPGDGLTFMYDPSVGCPLDASGNPIRVDTYNRPLPATPCLPVCESLIYYGEPM